MKTLVRFVTLVTLSLASAVCLLAQESAAPAQKQDTSESVRPAQTSPPVDRFQAMIIPRDSKVYIAPFKSENTEKPVEGFETYMAAALRKKNVPLIMVAERSQADFEIVGTADKKGAGAAKKILLGDWRSTTSASISVINLKTGVIAYADASHRSSANKGLRSSAEKLAKYLKKKMEDDEKKVGATSTTR